MKENGREGEREICPCLLFAQPTLPFVHPNSTHHHPFMHIITTPHVIIQGQMSFFLLFLLLTKDTCKSNFNFFPDAH